MHIPNRNATFSFLLRLNTTFCSKVCVQMELLEKIFIFAAVILAYHRSQIWGMSVRDSMRFET